MKIAIVGSRRRKDKETVFKIFDLFCSRDIEKIISGGCRGVDTWAEREALKRGMVVQIFRPDLRTAKTREEIVQAYYNRNRKIVENADAVVALVAEDRKGGTENTIKWAKKLNKLVLLVEEVKSEEDK